MKDFLGYGSPEALEQAVTAVEGADFTVYSEGLVYASVCSSLSKDEVVARMKSRPSGTKGGWMLSDEPSFASGDPNPCPCNRQPATRKHYLFEC